MRRNSINSGKAKVVLTRCESYNELAVEEAVSRGLELLDGVSRFAREKETVLLKPNMLVAEAPDKSVTTHPSVFKAVIKNFKPSGARIVFGDAPAFGSPKRVAKKTGLLSIAEELGVELVDFLDGKPVNTPDGSIVKQFTIANGVLESDGLISLPKLKTHALERMTGAIKNQFGCVPGLLKANFHARIPNPIRFGQMLVELNRLIQPRLYIMDGIMAMEGNGPRGGKPFPLNVIIMSTDPVALDATVCRMIDMNPEFVPPIVYGETIGMGVYKESDIEVLGDALSTFKVKNFSIIRQPVNPRRTDGIWPILNESLSSKPFIDASKCTRCGTCVTICPVDQKAVNWPTRDHKAPPIYNYQTCIRCYCCQEVCPEGAIVLKTPLLRKLFDRLTT